MCDNNFSLLLLMKLYYMCTYIVVLRTNWIYKLRCFVFVFTWMNSARINISLIIHSITQCLRLFFNLSYARVNYCER